MKKLFLSLIALVMTAFAFNINAETTTVYVVGAGDGLNWDLPGKSFTGEDGVVTFTVTNLTKLKISKNNSTAWDGDDSFNAGAYGPSTAFGDAVYPNGQTRDLIAWGEDVEMPYTATYTITMDYNTMKMTAKTAEPKPTDAPKVYIRGGMNNWGSTAPYEFTNVSYGNNAGVWTWSGSISKGVEFKIADGSWGSINYSANKAVTADGTPINMTYNGGNMTMADNFTGTITLNITNISGHVATATFSSGGDVPEPTYPENLYIIGTINGGAWDPANVAPMTNEGDGLYTIEKVTLAENGGSTGFAITVGGSSWDDVNSLRFGPAVNDTPAVVGDNSDIAMGDLSWSIEPGTYSMSFDYNDRVLTIEKAGDTPIDPTPDPEGSSVYVVGAGDGLTWDLPGTEFKGENGVYTFNLTNVSKFKVSTANTTDWDTYNASAYATGEQTFTETGVYSEAGETLPVVSWGDDQMLPYTGNYTITLNLNAMTMTAKSTTAPSTEAPVVYIRGAFNDWGTADTYMFTNINWDAEARTGEWTWEGSLNAGSEFKIADSNWSNINYGGVQGIAANETVELAFNSEVNLTLASAFEGKVTFKVTGPTTATVYFAQEGEIKDPEQFYVIGTLEQGAWKPNVGVKMESKGEGIYTADPVILIESEGSCGFAIVANLGANDTDWSTVNALRFGPAVNDTPAVIGVNTDLATGDLSWTISEGSYKMVFDYKNRTLTISESENTNVISGIEAENGTVEYFNLQGVRVANPERGIFIRVENGKASKVVK